MDHETFEETHTCQVHTLDKTGLRVLAGGSSQVDARD